MLTRWIDQLPSANVLLVPGGGRVADAIRSWDRTHSFNETIAHWLAIRSLNLTAHVLATLLSRAEVCNDLGDCDALWRRGAIPILAPESFMRLDESDADHLPHTWSATSDSIAARVAIVAKADRLVLLKSARIPDEMNWEEMARAGIVDPVVPGIIAKSGLNAVAIELQNAIEG
jgi:aspartokinase-like uncharacterized kinase